MDCENEIVVVGWEYGGLAITPRDLNSDCFNQCSALGKKESYSQKTREGCGIVYKTQSFCTYMYKCISCRIVRKK